LQFILVFYLQRLGLDQIILIPTRLLFFLLAGLLVRHVPRRRPLYAHLLAFHFLVKLHFELIFIFENIKIHLFQLLLFTLCLLLGSQLLTS